MRGSRTAMWALILLAISLPARAELRVKHLVGLEYPWFGRLVIVEGKVELVASIAPDGTVREVRSASGPEPLAKPARDALSHWTFDGCESPQGCELRIVFLYVLSNGKCEQASNKISAAEFEADLPNQITIKATKICAIVN
jgi:hypothetical protein